VRVLEVQGDFCVMGTGHDVGIPV